MEVLREFVPVISFIGGFLLKVAGDKFKHWCFGPKLHAEHEPSNPTIEYFVIVGDVQAVRRHRYLRINISNKGQEYVKDCRAYLTKIERYDVSEKSYQSLFDDTMRLRWAYEQANNEHHKGVDIPKGIKMTVDLVSLQRSSRKSDEKLLDGKYEIEAAYLQERTAVNRLSLIAPETRYRFTVAVCAANAAPAVLEMNVSTGNGNPENLHFL